MSSPAPTSDTPAAAAKKGAATSEVTRVGRGDVVIAARKLSYWYGQVIGVNDISIDIGQGVVGLLGPNGAGKSTLLKCLTGQLRPATGMTTLGGERVWNNAAAFAKLGFVPEQDAFYEEMSGRAFVTHLTRLQGFSKSDAATLAEEAIATVSLSEQAHRPIREYSKGMRQRIKIAQALAHRPQVLFFDEPLTGTDPVGRRTIIDLIRKLGDKGRTVVVSSHILHEVEAMTSDIVLINRGRVLADGNIYRIREMIDEHPHRIYVECESPRKLASLLSAFDDTLELSFTERGFFVSTSEPDLAYSRIASLSVEHKLTLHALTSSDNDLSAVFRYLVS
ncbi:ABC transporter ATP-binding protein [Lujinxingia vulgaris]|uniref:ABC transporter ATP-binding protein n=1 Tax=Lujinxingia vulgaris TaxID=2600176 RepID=A0A5C6X0I8_9DELT|nr:ABC transporter ATP-binding protein [Lujinxingia vulgaris]TXD32224.1 ABC transporter ATP-binding protein [Lujinxingia vulgaris]